MANWLWFSFSDQESVDRAIARWDGQTVTDPNGESFMFAVNYPRFSPRNPKYQPNFDRTNYAEGRRQSSRRSSNASQQQHNRRLNPNISYNEARGAGPQGLASGAGGRSISHNQGAQPISSTFDAHGPGLGLAVTVGNENVPPGQTTR